MFEWQLYGMSGKMKAQSNLEFDYFRVGRVPAKTMESSAQPRSLFPGPCQPARHLRLKPSRSHQASNHIGEDAPDLRVGGWPRTGGTWLPAKERIRLWAKTMEAQGAPQGVTVDPRFNKNSFGQRLQKAFKSTYFADEETEAQRGKYDF